MDSHNVVTTVKELPYEKCFWPVFIGASPGRLYFLAEGVRDVVDLWMTDGTETGTVMVKQIRPPRED